MHERTERAIARLLFVFCCAVPTSATMLAILISWTPWYHGIQREALSQRLSNQSGLIVEVGDFDRTSPNKWALHQVRVVEPETESEVLRVRQIIWENQQNRVTIDLHQPEIQSSMLKFAWSLTHDRFLCRPELTKTPVVIATDALTIHSQTGAMSLVDVIAGIETRPTSVAAKLKGTLAGEKQSQISISVSRNRSGKTPKTHWHLESGTTPLPCSALAGYLPDLKRFGPDALFTGNLKWEVDRDGDWLIDLGGSRFSEIDLSYLFEHLPHRLTGKADLTLGRCQIVPDQRAHISGSLRATNGWMGRSLLRSLHNELSFGVDRDSIAQQQGDVAYKLVSFNFDMTDRQLKLHGTCRNEPGFSAFESGIVAVGFDRALAKSSESAMPSVKLAYAIASENSQLVPVSPHTAPLLKVFVPPSHAIPIDDAVAPHSQIKRATPWSGSAPIQQPLSQSSAPAQ